MTRLRNLILIALLFFIALLLYRYIKMSGVLSTPEDMLADRCDKIPVAIDAQASLGTEDIVVDRETGLVMISAMNRFDRFARNQNPVDGIYGFVIDQEGNSQAKELRLLSLDAPAEFHPHGIDFWQDINKDGSVEKRLFVVNHINDIDKAVEVFRINTDLNLTHLYSVTSSEIYSPNDLAAVGPDQFYISNDHGRGQGLARMVEQYLFLPRSNVVFYDGEEAEVVARGLVYANGMAASADKQTIYVANPPVQKIVAFTRNQDNSLDKQASYHLNSAPDNIDVAVDGSLWTGAHKRIFEYMKYAQKERATAPSHVIRVDPETGETSTVLYTDNGELSASSTAVTYAGRLLVGSVMEGAVLNCHYSD